MCGIGGLWSPDPATDLRTDALAIIRAQQHRGPDGHGVWTEPLRVASSPRSPRSALALAHCRLAILDRSSAGAQPMASRDGRWHIVYNGEIYNHLELRAQLDQPFAGHCDTETLLAAVAAWGLEATLAKAQGMFALACWDAHTRTLHLARDAFGKKPLYYGWLGRTLGFASELKALAATLAWRDAPPALDRQALALYFRYAAVPAPWCIWQGLQSLPPGALLQVSEDEFLAHRLPQPQQWWRLGEVIRAGVAQPFQSLHSSIDVSLQAMRPLLEDAVRCRLQADVPVGVFLSGGVDSSLVAALAAAAVREGAAAEIIALTMGSTHAGYDETAAARQTAAMLGLAHVVEPVTEADALACIPDLPLVYDEPFADASQLPTLLLSRLARRHAVVLLSGDGGDELFAGYTRHLRAPGVWRRLESIPLPLRRLLASLLRHGGEALLAGLYEACAPRLPGRWRQTVFRDKIHKLGRALTASSSQEFYHSFLCQWTASPLRVPVVTPDPLAQAAQELADLHLPFAFWMQAMDQAGYLAWDILPKVDRASMAASIEVRCPLLDRRVAAAAWRLPASARMAEGRGKVLLRAMLQAIQPMPHLDRPKQGFGVPLEHWLRGPLKTWAGDLLHPSLLKAQGYLDPAAVGRAWDDHQSGRRNRQYELWTALMFQRWLEVWRP